MICDDSGREFFFKVEDVNLEDFALNSGMPVSFIPKMSDKNPMQLDLQAVRVEITDPKYDKMRRDKTEQSDNSSAGDRS